ncbi:unnamed protein product [Rhizophagus irregularis]|uniref:Uncharacterized protein n=1 Tax=Rhizophagus irregularis TaxID=588596 RepID=A0A915YZ63_9GLOM|nr:unnamed protein product [Rhizophagus irregularis]CAB5355751.1 unnamed protein product [Rhizophagus irregularis]
MSLVVEKVTAFLAWQHTASIYWHPINTSGLCKYFNSIFNFHTCCGKGGSFLTWQHTVSIYYWHPLLLIVSIHQDFANTLIQYYFHTCCEKGGSFLAWQHTASIYWHPLLSIASIHQEF